jgi:hypothetical protein
MGGYGRRIGARQPARAARLPVPVVAMLTVLALAATASPAYAVDEHAFDPVLSLTGDTSVSAQDQVPDPGAVHPGRFKDPCGIATDRHGYVYVASAAPNATQTGHEGRIDIFDPQGSYVTHFKDEHEPCQLAVDSQGSVFVYELAGGNVQVFTAGSLPPTATTSYTQGAAPVTTITHFGGGLAVDPLTDHLYVAKGDYVEEYDSLANGSTLLDDTIGEGIISYGTGVDVCGASSDIYVAGELNGTELGNARIYVFSGAAGHPLERALDGSNTPEGSFAFTSGRGNVAVDQANCDLYVGDVWGSHEAVHQFDAEGNFIGQLKHSLEQAYPFVDLAVDSPAPGQTGYDSPNEGHVFVTSANGISNSHVYAFKPRVGAPPAIAEQEATQVTATEAVLRAKVNPGNLPTTYRFEYVTQTAFKAEGYAGATSVPVPEAGPIEGGAFVAVSEPIGGLQPGTSYRFRLVASNEECGSGATTGEGAPCAKGQDATFATYPDEAGLPDGRGYELVTPPDTGGRIPTGSPFGILGSAIPTPLASPDGGSVLFAVEGGSLGGLPGSGYLDSYEARRRSDGRWITSFAGLSGAEAQESIPEGASPGHGITFHDVSTAGGSLDTGDPNGAFYLRYRDGGVEPVGRGSLGDDTRAEPREVSEDGTRVVFATGLGNLAPSIQLEPDAPPTGTGAVYQRALGGPTRVVSLLPNDVKPAAGEDAAYVGASADGSAIAFEIEGILYLRLDGKQTVPVASGDPRFGGLSRDGRRLVYLQPNEAEPLVAGTQIPQGAIHVFDPEGGGDTPIGSGDKAVLVNVSADASHVYFVSPQKLDGSKGVTGADNLYVWDGSTSRFIATLEHEDVTGDGEAGGLGLWVPLAVDASPNGTTGGPASAPSRSTPDGAVLVFEAAADLAPSYATGGHIEVYRYSALAGSLACVSCNPTGARPVSDAALMSRPSGEAFISLPPINAITEIANVTPDGGRVLFQSGDRLGLSDRDVALDVYEWRASGVGGCARGGGCIGLISSGQSTGDEYLYAMSADGSDVFFWSGERLLSEDIGDAPSIYDARIGGGAPASPAAVNPCLGEACQPAVTPPAEPNSIVEGEGNVPVKPRRRCRGGKRRDHRRGVVRCVKRRRQGRHPGTTRPRRHSQAQSGAPRGDIR